MKTRNDTAKGGPLGFGPVTQPNSDLIQLLRSMETLRKLSRTAGR